MRRTWRDLVWIGCLAPLLVGCGGPEPGAGELEADPEAGADGAPSALSSAAAPEPEPAAAPAGLLDYRHRPPSRGMDSLLLAEALEEAAALPRLHNVIVARHGEVVAERHVRGPGPDRPANVKSASKSVLAAVVGLALADGHLDGVDEFVHPYFPEVIGADDEARRQIQLRHLLTMSSGLESTSSRNYGRWVASSDWVRHALTRPMISEPGGRMSYSTGDTHLLSAIVTRATGRSTHAYARERLAEPLGIQLPPWLRDPQGIYFGGNDMALSPRALLRIGELYRNGGVHEGRQLLPREWVEESWRVHVRSPRRSRHGYGYGWWARTSGAHEVRFAWGYGGQFVFVVPALELTVVFTSDPVSPREGPHNAALHRLIDRRLVPAAEAGSGAPVRSERAP